MEKQIAYCGLVCTDCNAYIATQNNDDEMRKETAATWSKEYNADIKPEDINCAGCLTESPVFHHCTVCEVRQCGRKNGVVNCAYCDEYGCETLTKYFEMAPVMKANLEEIRKGLKTK
jgi:hypothetical protein